MVDTLEKKQKGGVGEFIQETRGELAKTTFPSREDVQKTTIIVVLSVIFFGVYLYVMDHFWVYVLEAVNWLVSWIAGV